MGGETVIPEVHALGNDEIKLLFRRLRVAEFLTGELFPQAEAASASAEAPVFDVFLCFLRVGVDTLHPGVVKVFVQKDLQLVPRRDAVGPAVIPGQRQTGKGHVHRHKNGQ